MLVSYHEKKTNFENTRENWLLNFYCWNEYQTIASENKQVDNFSEPIISLTQNSIYTALLMM